MKKIKVINYALLIVLAGCLYLIFDFLMGFQNNRSQKLDDIALLDKKIREQKEKLNSLREIKAEVEKYQTKITATGAKLGQLEALLPKNLEVSKIIREIVSISKKSKLNLGSINPSPEFKMKDAYMVLPIDFEITGKYQDLMTMLNNLGGIKPIFNITKMDVTSVDNGVSGNVTAGLHIEYYRQKDPQ